MNEQNIKGFSLLELMIAIGLGIIIAAATLSVYVSSARTNSDSLRGTRLSQELRGAMGVITRDLRRAGSWSLMRDMVITTAHTDIRLAGLGPGVVAATGTGTDEDESATPFAGFAADVLLGRTFVTFDAAGAAVTGAVTAQADGTLTINLAGAVPDVDINAGKWTLLNPFRRVGFTDVVPAVPDGLADDNCIMYEYDANEDGLLNDGPFGFRLNAGNLEMAGTATNCADDDDGLNDWVNLTDNNTITITAFDVESYSPAVIAAGGLQIAVQEYRITLTGQLSGDASITRTIRQSVKVRNNFIGTGLAVLPLP